MTSATSQRSAQIRLQRSSSSRCRLSRPSTQLPIQDHEPVPCVQVLFRIISQAPVCLPKLLHLFSELLVQKPACDAVPKVASVHRLTWMCGVRTFEQVHSCSRPKVPSVCQLSGSLETCRIWSSLSQRSCPLLAKIPLVQLLLHAPCPPGTPCFTVNAELLCHGE